MGNVSKYFALTIIIFTLIFIYLGISILVFGFNVIPIRSDCIIILGCQVYNDVPSPFLKSRMDEGLRLYNKGYSKYIIVSGGKGKGETVSEAQAMKKYLVSKGAQISCVFVEDKSTSTIENIDFSKQIMNKYNMRSAIIVSNRYHLKRASLIAKRAGISGSYSGVFVSDHRANEYKGFLREILALARFYIIK